MIAFSLAAAVAVLAALLMITRRQAMHALLYLVVSLLATALLFVLLEAPFAAALEVIVYAGAIMILVVFVVMLVSSCPGELSRARREMPIQSWVGPSLLSAVLVLELAVVVAGEQPASSLHAVGPVAVGRTLFGPYALGVQVAAFLLLAGLVGAFHLGRRRRHDGEEPS